VPTDRPVRSSSFERRRCANSGHENRPKSLFVNSAPGRMWLGAVFKHSASRPAELITSSPVNKRRFRRVPQREPLSNQRRRLWDVAGPPRPTGAATSSIATETSGHRPFPRPSPLPLVPVGGLLTKGCQRHCPPRRRGVRSALADRTPQNLVYWRSALALRRVVLVPCLPGPTGRVTIRVVVANQLWGQERL